MYQTVEDKKTHRTSSRPVETIMPEKKGKLERQWRRCGREKKWENRMDARWTRNVHYGDRKAEKQRWNTFKLSVPRRFSATNENCCSFDAIQVSTQFVTPPRLRSLNVQTHATIVGKKKCEPDDGRRRCRRQQLRRFDLNFPLMKCVNLWLHKFKDLHTVDAEDNMERSAHTHTLAHRHRALFATIEWWMHAKIDSNQSNALFHIASKSRSTVRRQSTLSGMLSSFESILRHFKWKRIENYPVASQCVPLPKQRCGTICLTAAVTTRANGFCNGFCLDVSPSRLNFLIVLSTKCVASLRAIASNS